VGKRKGLDFAQWVAVVTAALAVPPAIQSIIGIADDGSHPRMVRSVLYGVVAVVGLVGIVAAGRWARQFVAPAMARWFASRAAVAHLDQSSGKRALEHYTRCLPEQLALLGLSTREFSRRASLPIWTAWGLRRTPDVVPRPDLWPQIEQALLLPEGFFHRGRAADGSRYGKFTRLRLQWFADQGLVDVHVFTGSYSLPREPRKLSNLLRRVEDVRREDLRLAGK